MNDGMEYTMSLVRYREQQRLQGSAVHQNVIELLRRQYVRDTGYFNGTQQVFTYHYPRLSSWIRLAIDDSAGMRTR